ncbi:MAG: alpha/beta hydrolase [Gemmatimonadaceae bacterium]
MIELAPQHITVPRTARYYVLGAPNELVRDVWIVCHGFGQLAANFIEPFAALEDDTRLIVAPEALSRFYLDSRPAHSPTSKVGATWMTREDRDVEIADVVTYLDALYERLFLDLADHGMDRDRVRVHALGFSQGGAAASRWAARGAAVVDNLVVWGSGIPQDVNTRALGERRPALSIDMVYGTGDALVAGEMVVAQSAVLEASGVPYRVHSFDGGHLLSRAVLRELMGVRGAGGGDG